MKNESTIESNLTAWTLAVVVILSSVLFAGNVYATEAAVSQKTGSWTDKKYEVNGGWEIVTDAGKTIIRFDESFSTKKGPDLKLFLSTQSIDEVTGKTVIESSVLVAELASHKGAQEYVLPDNIKLDEFASLLIHCEEFSVLWGGAAI